jgi:D-threo-aldose 1-dehydrogenase
MGAVLREHPREDYVVSTKVGRLLEPTPDAGGEDDEGFAVPATHRRRRDYSRDGVLRSLEASLERLGLDRVDVLFVHDPDEHYREVLDGAYPALHALRDEGVVRAIGAGMNQAEMLAGFVRNTDMDLVMLAGRYTLLEQDALDDLLPACERRGVSVVAAGVFNSGLLARARPPDDAKYNYAEAPRALVERARRIAEVCERHGASLPAAALAFPLAHPVVASVCVGARSPRQMARNAALFAADLPGDLWAELRAEGLLREDAPVPGARA